MTIEFDRYARQRLIQWWDQERLAAARIFVAGAGALGNELLKNLALLGVGQVTIIDFDRIEASNLSRTVLFTAADVGRLKVEAAEAALRRINPQISVTAIAGDLFYDVGLGHYRHSDLVIGCLDSLGARSQVGVSAALAGVPYLDGGMWSLGGEVRWLMAGDGPCFDCTMSAADRARADERRSCSGFRDPAWDEAAAIPTVATTAATIAGMMAQEAAKYLCGHAVLEGKAIVYNGQALTMHRAELRRDPACVSPHLALQDVLEADERAADLTPRRLVEWLSLGRSETSAWRLELGRDFLLAFACPGCGRRQGVSRLWGQVLEQEQHCPNCGAARQPELLRTVMADSPYAEWSLAELGVPPGEVLAVWVGERIYLLELTADVVAGAAAAGTGEESADG